MSIARIAQRLQQHFWRILLGGLMVVTAVSSAVICALHNHPLMFDPLRNFLSAASLSRAASAGTTDAWHHWLSVSQFRPPLASILYQPAMWLVHDQRLAIRMTELVLLLATIYLIYNIGCRLASPAAGTVAALMFAAFPLVQLWSRMANADPVIWFTLTLLFRVLVGLDLKRSWQAVALGISIGLCLATRLLALVFLIGPCLWLAAVKVRDRRALLNLFVVAVSALFTAGWWYISQMGEVARNLGMSSTRHLDTALETHPLLAYLDAGYGWMLGGALVAGILALRRRLLASDQLALFGAWILVPMVQLVFLWDFWERYPLALAPQCFLVVSVVSDLATRKWQRAPRRALWGALVLAGITPLGLHYLVGAERLLGGLMRPDTQHYDALYRVLEPVPDGAQILMTNGVSEFDSLGYTRAILLAQKGERYSILEPYNPTGQTGGHVRRDVWFVLHFAPRPGHLFGYGEVLHPWWKKHGRKRPRRLLARACDPNNVCYEVHELSKPFRGRWSGF